MWAIVPWASPSGDTPGVDVFPGYDFVPIRDDQAVIVHDGVREIRPS